MIRSVPVERLAVLVSVLLELVRVSAVVGLVAVAVLLAVARSPEPATVALIGLVALLVGLVRMPVAVVRFPVAATARLVGLFVVVVSVLLLVAEKT